MSAAQQNPERETQKKKKGSICNGASHDEGSSFLNFSMTCVNIPHIFGGILCVAMKVRYGLPVTLLQCEGDEQLSIEH